MSAKLWAFRRLQYTHEDRQQALYATPIAKLRKLCVQNGHAKLCSKIEDAIKANLDKIG